MRKLYSYLKKKVVFFIGDIKHISSFPWITWASHEHGVAYDEVLSALPKIEYGDIGLHRDAGYLSNVFIPGFMKHGWIHIQDGVSKPEIIEALSEGVVKRNALYPLFSDYSIILSPKGVTAEERKGACKKAEAVVGVRYDVDFKFDIEEELAFYEGSDTSGARDDLQSGAKALQVFDYAFSCTETLSYAWWHKREQLRLYKKVRRGQNCILADDFLNHSWTIKWLSTSVSVEAAQKYNLHEEGVEMIRDYWRDQKNTAL